MACLMIVSGAQSGSCYPLRNRTLTAGRDPARDIQLLDPRVSRKHFQIRKEVGDYIVVGLRNANSVYVNGIKIAEKVLQDGDQIRVGNTLLMFLEDDEPDRSNALNKYKQVSREARDDQTIKD